MNRNQPNVVDLYYASQLINQHPKRLSNEISSIPTLFMCNDITWRLDSIIGSSKNNLSLLI